MEPIPPLDLLLLKRRMRVESQEEGRLRGDEVREYREGLVGLN
jgi:hypothetical protein